MPQSVLALGFLACPLGMALMMWMMGRHATNQPTDDAVTAQVELDRMRAEVQQLRAARGHDGQALTR